MRINFVCYCSKMDQVGVEVLWVERIVSEINSDYLYNQSQKIEKDNLKYHFYSHMQNRNWLELLVAKQFSKEQWYILYYYKVAPCPYTQPHDLPACLFFHSVDDVRKFPFNFDKQDYNYKPVLCEVIDCNGQTNEMTTCGKCHNVLELNFHPARYKTVLCRRKNCKRLSPFCPGIHEGDKIQQIQKVAINMDSFKTQPCELQVPHSRTDCFKYHGTIDRRRNPKSIPYLPFPCEERCEREDCLRSHNQVQILFHPHRYKTKFCQNPNNCEFNKYCAFAHSQSELRIKLIHLDTDISNCKTEWCPFPKKHDNQICPYAHSLLDYRRNPRQYFYEPIECPNWKPESLETDYSLGGCPNGMHCMFSHSITQLEMHPQVMKFKGKQEDKELLSKSTKASEQNQWQEHQSRMYFVEHFRRRGKQALLLNLPKSFSCHLALANPSSIKEILEEKECQELLQELMIIRSQIAEKEDYEEIFPYNYQLKKI